MEEKKGSERSGYRKLICPECQKKPWQRKAVGKYIIYQTRNKYVLKCLCCRHKTDVRMQIIEEKENGNKV